MLQFLWAAATPGDLAMIVLPWIVATVVLVASYAKTRRWDGTWKARWEHRHSSSLETLRRRKQQTLKAVAVVRWVAQALFFMSIGYGLWPIIEAERERGSVTIMFAAFSVFILLGLSIFAASTKLLKYQIKRIDELLSVET